MYYVLLHDSNVEIKKKDKESSNTVLNVHSCNGWIYLTPDVILLSSPWRQVSAKSPPSPPIPPRR